MAIRVTIKPPEVKPIKVSPAGGLAGNSAITNAITISEDLPYDMGGNSFGELSGQGTYTPPVGGITIIDFIKDVLVAALPVNASISASPSPLAYNLASATITVTPTFSSGNSGIASTATVTRILNGVETEISADATSGAAISDAITLNTLPGSSSLNSLSYRVDVTDANGTTGLATTTVAQTSYSEPTVSQFNILRSSTSTSSDETNLFREKGNVNSSVNFLAVRNSPEVDMTSVVLYRGAPLAPNIIDTETPVANSGSHYFSHSDTSAPTTDYYYSVQIGDGHPNSPADFTSSTVNVDGFPTLFTAYNQEYDNTATDAQIEGILTNFNASDGYYKLRNIENSYTLTSTTNMNSGSHWAYIIYDAGLGALNSIKQGGSTGSDVLPDFTDLGTFTIQNQFSASLSVRVYRSDFSAPFNNQTVFIEF